MKVPYRLFLCALLISGGFMFAGCEEESDIEQGLEETGEGIERSAEQATDEVGDRL